eukprot:6202685-Pleurochrysis_carterae.AAC.2
MRFRTTGSERASHMGSESALLDAKEYRGNRVRLWPGVMNAGDSLLLQRCKLRFLEMLALQGVSALYLDVHVLALSPRLLPSLAAIAADAAIASDARTGAFSDAQGCPASPSMYQRYSKDWVSSSLMYLKGSKAAAWLLREVRSARAPIFKHCCQRRCKASRKK